MGSTPIKNVSYQDLDQVATQAAPATGKTRFYSKSDGALYVVPAAGSETAVSAGVPANVVAYFNGAVASIPSGWTEFTAARGRVIVGVPLSGTGGGTVGTALTNLQDPTHTHTGPSHAHDSSAGQNGAGGESASGSQPYGTGASWSGTRPNVAFTTATMTGNLTNTAGTGVTGATSATMPYIQQPAIVKS